MCLRRGFFVFILLISVQSIFAQQQADGPYINSQIEKGAPYTLALLVHTGLQPNKDSAAAWHMLHLQNMFQLHLDKKISVFGPVTGENADSLAGMIVFNSSDEALINKWMSKDPYLVNKVMTLKYYKWFSIPGQQLATNPK